MHYNAAMLRSKIERGAPPLELAITRFNDYGPLLRMHRLDKVRDLLAECRAIFEAENATSELGLVFSALSSLETAHGRAVEARRFEETSLRYKYLDGEPASVAGSHFNLASRIFEGEGDEHEALSHRLAALLLAAATKSGRMRRYGAVLAADLSRVGRTAAVALPATFAALSDVVERVDGVKFAAMLTRLTRGRNDELLQIILSQLTGS